MGRHSLLALSAWLLVGACAAMGDLSPSQIADFKDLSKGLTTLATATYYSSRHVLLGSAPMAVAVASDGSPIVSATRYGAGRAIHFGHDGMMSDRCCTGTGLGGLVANAAQWSAGTVTSGIRVAQFGMSTVVNNLVAKVSINSSLARPHLPTSRPKLPA
jgi:hypothetical protein